MEQKTEPTGNNTFVRRIGTTIYQVNVFFDEKAEKSFEEKLMHLMSNDLSLVETGNNDNK
ncbi:transposon-encoded TnpW family protein [Novisyntrophococcus fermenticellae]|uniref:transposon-encoded TnpW family protein n=1 Tax=Novisyntrophococcus fermenticellae TaxID=2068655 RepID=UPI001E3704DD|nr:transposon-encoded TnpW family protein [Novisyntrophococcus fermenticellae]